MFTHGNTLKRHFPLFFGDPDQAEIRGAAPYVNYKDHVADFDIIPPLIT